ncbi:hypothetical protein DPMN_007266 [Dreissena polymorpha]|uniref:Uncharacterized protein n=1 Tax=Dreissena polymorpha TaxID=45954 RepID=A0A9D4MSZ8_DREPO|nr:hypothetical protein DPMN_007266 [Dreissena polymorpha]
MDVLRTERVRNVPELSAIAPKLPVQCHTDRVRFWSVSGPSNPFSDRPTPFALRLKYGLVS